MNNEKKLFILTDLSDLNEKVLNQLNFANKNDSSILELFKIKQVLTIDEIIVGLARKFNKCVLRSYLINRLYALSNKGLIRKIKGKKGTYKLIA